MKDQTKSTSLPTCNRTVTGSKNKTLKMSIGKQKLHSDEGLARLIYEDFILNGAQYCRAHLMIRCHLCKIDYGSGNDREDANEERERLGYRAIGDPKLDEVATEWGEKIKEDQLVHTLKSDNIRIMGGGQDEWDKFYEEGTKNERKLNDAYLAAVQKTFDEGASQCCYYACKRPRSDHLLRCAGCRVAKYCSKECQKLDWSWEHKGECMSSVPQFLKDEIEFDRQRHLQGDYSDIERD